MNETKVLKKKRNRRRNQRIKSNWTKLKKQWKVKGLSPTLGIKFPTFNAKDRKFIYKLLVKRDGNKCWLCKKTVPSPDKVLDNSAYAYSLDHIIPVSKGGCHCLANIRLAHRKCNSERKK